MKVLLCQPSAKDNAAWLEDLRAALPQVQFDEWRPGMPPVYDAAVVWSPPQQLIDEQPQLRALLNLGAGVDKLLALRLPPALPVVRLEDAGMAVQMAEYVCHALIRFFREFDAYERQQRESRWHPRRPHVRSEFPVGVMGLGALGARVAQAVQQFDFPVLGWSRTPRDLPGVHCFHGDAGLPDFLQGTRVLVSLLPLTPATRGILNRQTLEQIQFKLLLLVVIFIYAFFRFTWALRQHTFCSIMIGAAPQVPKDRELTIDEEQFAQQVARVSDRAAHEFNYGLRSYYFALSLLAWFISPILFMGACTLVVVVLYLREFRSRTLSMLVRSRQSFIKVMRTNQEQEQAARAQGLQVPAANHNKPSSAI